MGDPRVFGTDLFGHRQARIEVARHHHYVGPQNLGLGQFAARDGIGDQDQAAQPGAPA